MVEKKLIFISILLITLSGSAIAGNSHFNWLPNFFKAPNFSITCNELISFARRTNNVYETLNLLISRYPQLKKTFTLVYDSDSIQFASKTEPRIIFFTPNGLFFSLSTSTQSNSIEIISFNNETKKFDFTEILFENNQPQINRNPKSCQACHNDRPIWDQYHSWKGVYGSEDDYFFQDRMTPESYREKAQLREFIRTTRNRFLRLIELDENDYYLNNFPDRNDLRNINTFKRRNTYLLYHLGYYNILTYNDTDDSFIYNLSFYRNSDSYGFGADYPYELAARTLLFGLQDNEIYQSTSAYGPFASGLRFSSASIRGQYQSLLRTIRGHSRRLRPSPLAKCISCHQKNSINEAPEIPFDDFVSMVNLVKRTNFAEKIIQRISIDEHGTSRQMPPDEPLTITEQEALIDYLNVLKR